MSEKKDIERVLSYLTHSYNKATSGLERAFRGKNTGPNLAYILDTEMAYLLNEIQRGPKSMTQVAISNCNQFIAEVVEEVEKHKKEKEQPKSDA